jgi:hypothetical protein
LSSEPWPGYTRVMSGVIARAVAVSLALIVAAAGAQAQTGRYKRDQRRATEPAVPAISVDKRDSLVTAPGPFNGRPYWLALAECGGVYFKLNVLYTDAAVHARVVKPDPKANADYTRKLSEAIKTATTYFDGAEHFLMTERGIERADAVLTYAGQSRAAGDRVKTVEAGIASAKVCPPLYHACREAYPKQCGRPLPPTS